MRPTVFQTAAAAVLATLVASQAGADPEKPDPWANQLFDSTVTCNAAENYQDRWNSPKINELVAKRGTISGRIQLLKAVPEAKYGSNVGLIALSADGAHFSEFAFYDCNNGRSVCAQGHYFWPELERGDKISVPGVFSRTAKIPLRIQFTGPRQWIVDYGGESVTLNFPYDVGALQVRCVSGKGWASFDLPRELVS